MDKNSMVNLMKLEQITGIKLIEDDLTHGPIFVVGAAEKTFNNSSVNRETLGLLLEKLADISRSPMPGFKLSESAGFIFEQDQVVDILVKLKDDVANLLVIEKEITQGEELPEGVSLVDLMRQKMTERTMHDVSKVFYDYGQVKSVLSPKVRKLDAPEQREYAITFSESDIDQMGEYLPHDVHHALITAFNQRVEQYQNSHTEVIEQGD